MAKPPTDTAAEKLQMLDFLTTGAVDAAVISVDDPRRFRRRLRRTPEGGKSIRVTGYSRI